MLLGLLFHHINKETEESIQSKNRKIERLAAEAEEYYNTAAQKLNERIGELDKCKEYVQSTTIKDFCDVFIMIKNITYERFKKIDIKNADYNSFEIVKIASGYDGKKGKIADYAVGGAIEGVIASTLLATTGIGGIIIGGTVGGIIRGSKLTDEEIAVKGALAQQEYICEEAKIRADLLNDTSNKCDELIEIIRVLNTLVARSTVAINEYIKQYGNRYDDWPESEQYLLMTSVNMVAGLNRIIVTPVVLQDGTINSKFVKLVDQSKTLPEGKPLNLEALEKEEESDYLFICGNCFETCIDGYINLLGGFFVYNPEFGDKKTNIQPGTNADQIPSSWKCPFCKSHHEKLIRISTKQYTQQEMQNMLKSIKTDEDYYTWICGMLPMTETEIMSFDVSERRQKVRDEIDRIEEFYDDDTLKEAGKTYGCKIKGYNWAEKLDREWIYTTYIRGLRRIKSYQLEFLEKYL